jgi:hypothetical protein
MLRQKFQTTHRICRSAFSFQLSSGDEIPTAWAERKTQAGNFFFQLLDLVGGSVQCGSGRRR